jgi:membrane-bound inhibitor of C-type lysozyme
MSALDRLACAAVAVLVAACQTGGPSKEEIEAAKKTVDCDRGGDRILIRFDEGEARLLMPDGSRVVLYPVPVASGARYTNGLYDLRGSGLDLSLQHDRTTMRMKCKQYELPVKKE